MNTFIVGLICVVIGAFCGAFAMYKARPKAAPIHPVPDGFVQRRATIARRPTRKPRTMTETPATVLGEVVREEREELARGSLTIFHMEEKP